MLILDLSPKDSIRIMSASQWLTQAFSQTRRYDSCKYMILMSEPISLFFLRIKDYPLVMDHGHLENSESSGTVHFQSLNISVSKEISPDTIAEFSRDYITYCTRETGVSEKLIKPQPLQVAYISNVNSQSPEQGNAAIDPTPIYLAGLSGHMSSSYLKVTLLWVSPTLRRGGVGRQLMNAAEDEASNRGCAVSLVDTYDFQAEGFYRSLGYEVYARLEGGFGGRAERIYLKKYLKTMLVGAGFDLCH